mmetsp:Transcript_4741/g.7266  ORF Transcript_4741/g.7266 Transcript_4741/m.7266 type:complete len:148 (+) Transcript_4741:20-463(+)
MGSREQRRTTLAHPYSPVGAQETTNNTGAIIPYTPPLSHGTCRNCAFSVGNIADTGSGTIATPTRWDLLDRIKFPQWHADLKRVVKYATSPTFLGSSPPPFNVASAAGPSTRSAMRSTSSASASHAHACTPTPAQEEWLKHNILLSV